MENTNNTQAASTATQPEENGGRTFTQEEVNKIVSDRLARERAKNNTTDTDPERETELLQRENALQCKEYIHENELPKELLEIFSTENADDFKSKIELLKPLLRSTAKPITTGCPTLNNSSSPADAHIRKAFGL